jgi:hypothetical protein
VTAFTVCYRALPDANVRIAVADAARASGCPRAPVWKESAGRAYALIERVEDRRAIVAAASGAFVSESPVIALAVYPNVAQALPLLAAAFAGAGRPSGVVSAEIEPMPGGTRRFVVEAESAKTGADVLLALVDIELARYRSARRIELLAELPLEQIARIAATGLRCEGITPDRILEYALDLDDDVA